MNRIITSLLDTDAYKLYMQQAVFHYYKDVEVEAHFICRCSDDLRFLKNLIEEQVRYMSELSLSSEEYEYLSGFDYFKKDYLDFLKNFSLNSNSVKVYEKKGQLAIDIKGLWLDVILWEVPLLAIISELFHIDTKYDKKKIEEKSINKLKEKLEIFYKDDMDLSTSNIVDFGTRRRFSKNIHEKIVEYLKEHFIYFKGTSNLDFARRYGIKVVGTQAHEWFQAHQQISKDLIHFQKEALYKWLEEYPNSLGIALTDCLNMDAFLNDLDENLANRFVGLRHDSGDPYVWGDKAIEHYKELKIEPKSKTLVFSDSLNFKKVLNIYRYFKDKTNLSFGIGTNLTCDVPDFKPLNIVTKLVTCNGKPVAKISDEPAKITSKDKNFVEKLKNTFEI